VIALRRFHTRRNAREDEEATDRDVCRHPWDAVRRRIDHIDRTDAGATQSGR
jgi:hypothetical protein